MMVLHLSHRAALRLVTLLMVLSSAWSAQGEKPPAEKFLTLMNLGKAYLDQGDAERSVTTFSEAVAIHPTEPSARLNLANAYLVDDKPEQAARQAEEALHLQRNSAAAYFILGCARNRLRLFEQAVKSFQKSKAIDPGVPAASFQLGKAYKELGWIERAIGEWRSTVVLEADHPAAHYALSRLLIRTGRMEEGRKELEIHRLLLVKLQEAPRTTSFLERCKHTRAIVPPVVDQPDEHGVKVTFADVSTKAFDDPGSYRAPVAAIDVGRDGWIDLFVRQEDGGFRLLKNAGGVFKPSGQVLPAKDSSQYIRCLVGDLDNDQNEDCLVVGPNGSHLFRFDANGEATDVAVAAGIADVRGIEAILVDLDHTGKLDLLVVSEDGDGIRYLRNRGNLTFEDRSEATGIPKQLVGVGQVVAVDWDGDQSTDVLAGRTQAAPLLLQNQLLGRVAAVEPPAEWPAGGVIAVDDINNDLRADLLIASGGKIECIFGGEAGSRTIDLGGGEVRAIHLVDYDNDGYLDLCTVGPKVRMWRNVGLSGFLETTTALGLDKLVSGTAESVTPADFDGDGDTDLLLTLRSGGLQLLRNDGGNTNAQLKMQLTGTRSNRSGIGVLVEITAGAFRTSRTVHRLPVEIGIGRRDRLDTVVIVWSDQVVQAETNVKIAPPSANEFTEPHVTSASCPYLYAWNGAEFRFVTDFLGGSPLGLRQSDERLIDADADEFVWIGDGKMFQPRHGDYVLQVTQELREVLYLDQAKLVAADHPVDTEVHPTDKLQPEPFPRSELVTLGNRIPLQRATTPLFPPVVRGDDGGSDVTDALNEIDGRVCSPGELRVPQLRGLAKRYGVTLDFGPLPTQEHLVLALTGWLQWGGATANVAASHNPDLPTPFPMLECETAFGGWRKVDAVVGAPAGKTKTIVVDLTNLLPNDARRLRLTTGLEIHWDRIALFERRAGEETYITMIQPDKADLHWHGFGEVEDPRPSASMRPKYDVVQPAPKWRFTPSGWCTRYGDVTELVADRDGALVLLNCGDEVTLAFRADRFPPVPDGYIRDFFFFSVGWDKDADYHVVHGRTVGPLPFHGMDSQQYGDIHFGEDSMSKDISWIDQYNTRWVGPETDRLRSPGS